MILSGALIKTPTISSAGRLLMDLIAIPSVNPAFSNDDAMIGEGRVAQFLAERSREIGLGVRWQSVSGGRRNLILQYQPKHRPRHRLLLAPHMDTVVASPAQFEPLMQKGRIYGRGACDTKGSIASMLDALAQLVRGSNRPRDTAIHMACMVDEEHGQMGSRAFARRCKAYDYAIIGEPTSNQLVTAHKGVMWFQLHTSGRAAHGSRPQLGISAIAQMAKVVSFLEGDYRAELERIRHPLLGPGTVNVGIIKGGVQPNIVPDKCSIWVDRRTLPGESYQAIARHLLHALKQRGVKASIEYRLGADCPALETSHELPWVKQCLHQLKQKEARGVDFFCDAAVIAQRGTPCAVFGPGSIDQAHTANEWISMRSLDTCVGHYLRFFRSLP
ncbi:M20/M25/M40 family metallo-hydrolase [bacterium]|nr:M20/M25/M40 family metallo-hydrolase [bacterium]